MGIARLALVGVAVLAVLALIGVGAVALVGTLDTGDAVPPGAAEPSAVPDRTADGTTDGTTAATVPEPSRTATSPPTLFVECRADRCPLFVRVSGGDVLEDRELDRGQEAVYSQPSLDVVLNDASTVYVEVNGTARPPGEPGERQSFTARRAKDG
ncbi:hypothetical protein Sru01_56790 [Sphaerisporangium rufum]|uniref:DUF4115 domain-containing protein n=2 Tax=Sphaerisporangium rufum TaxID=1381558 RepID=A0A919V3D6_9ACTN|nr:hypothetical protein Sru01_56790 [Sphaerisporangium rufum]